MLRGSFPNLLHDDLGQWLDLPLDACGLQGPHALIPAAHPDQRLQVTTKRILPVAALVVSVG